MPCPNATKFTRTAFGRFHLNGILWGFTPLFLLKFIGNMPLILYESALHRFRHKPPNWTLMISATFKFISAPKRWLTCTTFSAMIPLHLRIHSSKNYLPISLHVFTIISSITSPTNTPRMMSQSILLTPLFLRVIPTMHPIFLNWFNIFLILYATPNFYHKRPAPVSKKRPPRAKRLPTTRKRAQRLYKSIKPPELASNSSCSRFSANVQAGNSRSHCRRLKLVKMLGPAR